MKRPTTIPAGQQLLSSLPLDFCFSWRSSWKQNQEGEQQVNVWMGRWPVGSYRCFSLVYLGILLVRRGTDTAVVAAFSTTWENLWEFPAHQILELALILGKDKCLSLLDPSILNVLVLPISNREPAPNARTWSLELWGKTLDWIPYGGFWQPHESAWGIITARGSEVSMVRQSLW